MSGPFTTITVRQYQAMQDVIIAAEFIEEQLKMLYEGKMLTDDQIVEVGIDLGGSRLDFQRALKRLKELRHV